MNLSNFSLLKEANDHYVVGHPAGKSIQVPKKGLSDKAHEMIKKLKKEQNFDEGGGVGDSGEIDYPKVEQDMASQQVNQNPPQDMQSLIQNTPSTEGMSVNFQVPDQPKASEPVLTSGMEQQASGQPEDAAKEVQPETSNVAPNNAEGLETAKTALEAGAAAVGKAGEAKTEAFNQLNEDLAKLPSQQDIFAKYQAKNAELEDKLKNNQIDPNRLWNNMSTGSKIRVAIGAMISGIGAGLTHTPNMAIQFLNKAIDEDIEAQKNQQGKLMSLYQMNRQALGDDQQANLATRNQLLTTAKIQAQAIDASTLGPLAKQNLANSILQIDQQKAMNDWMLSRAGVSKPGTEQQHIADMEVMSRVNPTLYKDMQSKYIPSIGRSRIPLSDTDRKTLTGYDSLGNAITDAINFQKNEAGPLGTIPGTAANAKANSIRNSIVLELNNLHGLNRLNDNEYKTYLNSVPSPGSFFSTRSLAMLGELQNQIQHHKQAEMGHLGVIPFQKTNNDQVAMTWARQNPGDPRAAEIMRRNGAIQ